MIRVELRDEETLGTGERGGGGGVKGPSVGSEVFSLLLLTDECQGLISVDIIQHRDTE